MKKNLLILSLAILLLPSLVFGATIFSDDFNSYNDGNLDGQGGWILSVGSLGDAQVQGVITNEGAKAIWFDNKHAEYKKVGEPIANGQIEVWVRAEDITAGTSATIYLIHENLMPVICRINKDEAGAVKCYDGTTWNLVGSIAPETWTNINIEWRTSDDKFRAKVGSGNWSEWFLCYSSFDTISGIIIGPLTTLSDFWFDTISETYTPPPPPAYNIFNLTTADMTTTATYMKDLFSDNKLLILLAIGLEVAFFVIKGIIEMSKEGYFEK